MADEFVDCRRKDDHSVTKPVAKSALPYFPDWEPLPDAEEQPNPTVDLTATALTGDPAPGGDTAPETGDKDEAKPKATRKATDTSKGRE